MFLIYGGGLRKKITKYCVEDACGQCGVVGKKPILTTYYCGTVFFIPIMKFGTKYFVVCPNCGAVKQISKKEYKNIKEANKNGKIVSLCGGAESVVIDVTSPKGKILKEIDGIIEKLKSINYAPTDKNRERVKEAIKENLLNRFENKKLVEEAVEEYFANMK